MMISNKRRRIEDTMENNNTDLSSRKCNSQSSKNQPAAATVTIDGPRFQPCHLRMLQSLYGVDTKSIQSKDSNTTDTNTLDERNDIWIQINLFMKNRIDIMSHNQRSTELRSLLDEAIQLSKRNYSRNLDLETSSITKATDVISKSTHQNQLPDFEDLDKPCYINFDYCANSDRNLNSNVSSSFFGNRNNNMAFSPVLTPILSSLQHDKHYFSSPFYSNHVVGSIMNHNRGVNYNPSSFPLDTTTLIPTNNTIQSLNLGTQILHRNYIQAMNEAKLFQDPYSQLLTAVQKQVEDVHDEYSMICKQKNDTDDDEDGSVSTNDKKNSNDHSKDTILYSGSKEESIAELKCKFSLWRMLENDLKAVMMTN